MTTVNFEPITPHLGANALIAADHLLDDGVGDQIRAALDKYGVLVFPQINIDDDTLIAFTNTIGQMKPSKVDGGKGIYHVTLGKGEKLQEEYVKGNDYWHMDGTSHEIPNKATLLKCEVPPNRGGETDFAHLFAAYEALPEDKKQQLEGLRVIHCMAAVGRKLYDHPSEEDFERWNAAFGPTEQPLVWHQKSGRTSLVIGSTADSIVGLSQEESQALLTDLLDWSTQEQFTYRHQWQKGDLVIFNNPGMLHRSQPYTEDSGRLMHRSVLEGEEAFSGAQEAALA